MKHPLIIGIGIVCLLVVGILAAPAVGHPVPAAEHTVYWSDFSYPNGSTPEGWTALADGWSVQDGAYRQAHAVGESRAWYFVGPRSQLSLQARATLQAGDAVRLHYNRAQSDQDYVEWSAAAAKIRIVVSNVVRREIDFPMMPGEPLELRVEVQSGWLYAVVNHHFWLDMEMGQALDGWVGLGVRNAVVDFDDVEVLDALYHSERPVMRLPYPAGDALMVGNEYKGTHRGVDFGLLPGDLYLYNEPMLSSAAGVVTHAERDVRNSLVTVRHGDQFEARYVHGNPLHVTVGQSVRAGEALGLVGRWGTHWDHVHYELYSRGEAIRPWVLSGYRSFCEWQRCGEWFVSDNAPDPPERVGIVARPNSIGKRGQVTWRDDFSSCLIDYYWPPPIWSTLNTQSNPVAGDESSANRMAGRASNLTISQAGGWLRLPGRVSSVGLRTRETYQNAIIRARGRFDDATPVSGSPRANMELRFRESDSGDYFGADGFGYAVVMNALGNVVQFVHTNTREVIGGYTVSRAINTGDIYYFWVVLDDEQNDNIHVRIGTAQDGDDVVNWRINHRQHQEGSIRLANSGAGQIGWDWVEVSGEASDPLGPDISPTPTPDAGGAACILLH